MSKEINSDYTEGPAGLKDQFVIRVVDMNKTNEKEPVIVKGNMKRVAISTELKGMRIAVEGNEEPEIDK